MKLCSLLILTKNTKKSKSNFKAPKKSEIVIFLGRILPCKQNKSAIDSTTFSNALDGEIRAIAANWCLVVRTWGDRPATLIVCPMLGRRHQHVAQCCRSIQSSFSKCLGVRKVCLGFKRFHGNVDIKYFLQSRNSEKNKIMIWGIHYFITKLKKKLMSSQGAALKSNPCSVFRINV